MDGWVEHRGVFRARGLWGFRFTEGTQTFGVYVLRVWGVQQGTAALYDSIRRLVPSSPVSCNVERIRTASTERTPWSLLRAGSAALLLVLRTQNSAIIWRCATIYGCLRDAPSLPVPFAVAQSFFLL